jgi:C_GCAxxG_C_C family probable redox protein
VGQVKLNVVDEAAIKAVGLFGGGIARSGNTCGSLLGAIAALSCLYSRGTLDEKENPVMWELGDRLVRRFEELTGQHGGIRCMDIARVDWRDPVAAKEFRTNPESRRTVCVQLVGDVAQALGELIDQETSGRRGHDVK